MTRMGMGQCVAIVGGTIRRVFEAYVERLLWPGLESRQVVVIDNPRLEVANCCTYGGPTYPIEEAFSKIKARSRRAEALAKFLEALDATLSAADAPDARGFIEHCDYRAAVPLS